jgi:hypothetical protein
MQGVTLDLLRRQAELRAFGSAERAGYGDELLLTGSAASASILAVLLDDSTNKSLSAVPSVGRSPNASNYRLPTAEPH